MSAQMLINVDVCLDPWFSLLSSWLGIFIHTTSLLNIGIAFTMAANIAFMSMPHLARLNAYATKHSVTNESVITVNIDVFFNLVWPPEGSREIFDISEPQP